jgi:NADPH2:quinone reductase
MRAIEVAEFGGPEVLSLRDLPDPVPRSGQVLVATSASDVLFVDTMIRSGKGADYFPIRPPYIPGNGVSGTVAALGAGVDESWLGRRVVAHTGGAGGGGGYAELVAADLDDTAVVPDGVDMQRAAAALHDVTTALRVIEVSRARAEDRVLILGAAGGMGIILVELLARSGAFVVGAARGKAKQDAVMGAGAHAFVDYGSAGWTGAVLAATGGQRPTVVLDGVGGGLGRAAFDLVAEGGRFSAHGAPSGSFAPIDGDEAERRRVRLRTIADLQYEPGDRPRLTQAALGKVADGEAKPLVGQTFALADAAQAHLAIESRTTVAKTLLVVD